MAAMLPAHATMRMGVNTHFEQGWPLTALNKVQAAGADGIRDSVMWGKVEQRPGVYDFSDNNSGFMNRICARSIPVLVMVPPRNKLYDGGMLPASEAGRRAFANYIVALAAHFPCIVGVEIGNEINTPSRLWPAPPQKFPAYVALLKEVRRALDAAGSRVALVGGSSIGVDVPFHERMFAAGELALVDAIAVHPYIDRPERLPEQIERLKQAMAHHGATKPIWCTEFGNYYKTPEAAPPHALKVMTIMSAAHVSRAYWYALLDEPWFRNMGLYAGDAPKPALATFRAVQQQLLSAGDARRIDVGDPLSFIYRFGDGPYVVWGTSRSLRLPAGARAFDARGNRIDLPEALGPEPVIIDAPAGYRPG